MKTRIDKHSKGYRWFRRAGCFGVVGAGVQAIASTLATQEMNKRVNKELKRQGGYQAQASDVTRRSIGASDVGTARGQIEAGRKSAEKGYEQATSTPVTRSTNRGIATDVAPAQSQAWAHLMASMRAPQQGYSEFTLQQMIKNLRAAQQLGVISQLARASAGALPLEVQQAQHSWDALANVGQTIGGGGNAGLQAAGVFG